MTDREKEEDRIIRIFKQRAKEDADDPANRALAYLDKLKNRR